MTHQIPAIYKLIIMSFLQLLTFNAFASPTVYEDAESGGISKWDIYDNSPKGALISNYFDTSKNSQVITFSGSSRSNGYRLGHQNVNNSNAWKNTSQKVISWDSQFNRAMTFFIPIQTTQGFRYLYYTSSAHSRGINSKNSHYIHHGIGAKTRNGSWHSFDRDLEADLQAFEPGNSITSVNGFLVRGSGQVDNILMRDQLPPPAPIPAQIIYEDAEDNTTNRWDIYDKKPTGAVISNTFDTQKNSQTIEFMGEGRQNGYRLGHNNVNSIKAWRNTFHTVISWSGKFSESVIIYIPVQTTLGFRYLYYTNSHASKGVSTYNNKYIHTGLGNQLTDGTWHTTTRDLQADLELFEPGNEISSVNGFLIRGNGQVDDILMKSSLHGDLTEDNAAKFLLQATFGPSEGDIDTLVAQNNLEAWIDQQLALPISRTLPYVEANSNGSLRSTRHDIWWKNVIEGNDQLRQRMAFALSQIFVISDRDYALGNAQYGVSHYYDMLAENAFGNYRELLEKVTLHPTMGIYLSMVRNQKANPALQIRPDENYAREVLQLFSVGLYELNERGEALPLANPIPSYSQNTVENFAKVFTGWNFADSTGTWVSNDLTPYDKRLAMVADYNTPVADSYHDTTTKTLLNGAQLLSSANSAEDDMQAALDNIASHPNVAPFFSKLLIQRFTTSNPSPDYVERVAAVFNDNGQGEKGDLAAVIKAILLDQEAINGKSVNSNFGKVKEPLMQLTQLWRAFDAQPGTGAPDNTYRLYAKAGERLDEVFGQAVLRSPSVFNFFLPDNLLARDSSLYAPEMQIMTEANIASMHNAFYQQIYYFNNQNTDGWDAVTRININKAVQLAPNSDALVEYLNKLLLAGQLGASQKSIITNHLDTISDSSERAQEAIFLIIASPTFQVQG